MLDREAHTSETWKEFINKYGTDSTTNFDLLKIARDINKPFYKQFRVCMRDELNHIPKHVKYIICNNQDSTETGSHWRAIYRDLDNNKAYVFDSYGRAPSLEMLKLLDYTTERYYSTFVLQEAGQTFCGQISMIVLYKLYKGEDFFDIVLELKAELHQ
jgi:hypothetical protein